MLLKILRREVSGTDLLGDTASLIGLDICFSQFVQDQGLARIDVTHNADNRATQFLCSLLLLSFLSCFKKGYLTGSAVASTCIVHGRGASTSASFFLLLLTLFLPFSSSFTRSSGLNSLNLFFL